MSSSQLNLTKSKVFWFIILITFANSLIYTFNNIRRIFYDQMVEGMGMTNTEFGVILGVYGLVCMIGYIPGGIIGDRFRLKYLTSLGLLGNALGILGLSFLPSYNITLVLYSFLGIVQSVIFWSCKFKLIRFISTNETYSRNVGFHYGMYALAGIVFTNFYLLFFDNIPDTSQALSYTLYAAAALNFVFAVLCFKFIPKFDNEINTGKGDGFKVSQIFEVLKYPGVWFASITLCAAYTIYTTLYVTSSLMTNVYGASLALVATFGSLRSYVVGLASSPLSGTLATRLKSASKANIIIMTGCAISIIVILFIPQTPTALVPIFGACLLMAFFANGIYGIGSAQLAEFGVPKEMFATATGVVSMLGFLPDMFGPVLIGTWLDSEGGGAYTNVFIMYLICSIVVVVTGFVASAYKKKTSISPELKASEA